MASKNPIVLAASAARNASGTGTEKELDAIPYLVMCDFTDKSTDIDDIMSVYVDVLVGTIWLNVCRFFQSFGSAPVRRNQYFTLTPNGESSVMRADIDCANGMCRPGLFGTKARARWEFQEGSGGGAGPGSFTFSVTMYPFA